MGGVIGYFWGGKQEDDPKLDVPDPVTGLTPREKKLVVDSWALVRPVSKPVGVELFLRYFEAYPEYQNRFSSFKGLSLAELRVSKKLTAHAANVMYALTSVVDNLDDTDCLVELLIKMGENHGRRRITEKEFHDLKTVLMQLLKDKLGNNLTSQGEVAWSKAIDVSYKRIFVGLKKQEDSLK